MKFLLLIALPCLAQQSPVGYTDTPMLPNSPYRVHDPARPHPAPVTPGAQPGAAPADAIVLFDGRDTSQWTSRNQWTIADGAMQVPPNGGDLRSKLTFGDIQLHVEWAAPAEVRNNSQNRGNSGIFLQGLYEIQVLDSWDNLTYADGQAGAIYDQFPPLANPVRKPGEWQSYDILFEAPRFEGDRLIKPAFVTVILNGIVLHHHQELMGPTVHRALAKYTPHGDGPIVLQDHQQPVRYRNIWVRRIAAYDQPER